jgi:quercetin dioxygenase-like cupin family protein
MKHLLPILIAVTLSAASLANQRTVVNLRIAEWSHEKDVDAVVLPSDPAHGGPDLLVRFAAGHVIAPHFHDSNERIIVVEGQLKLQQATGFETIETGGFAYLPAKEVQRLSCGPASRCSFYLFWDGSTQSHPAN